MVTSHGICIIRLVGHSLHGDIRDRLAEIAIREPGELCFFGVVYCAGRGIQRVLIDPFGRTESGGERVCKRQVHDDHHRFRYPVCNVSAL